MKSLSALKREAQRATAWRGHRMRWFEANGYATAFCIHCGMEVQCRERPAPNDIDIGGEAVALTCTGVRKGVDRASDAR
jgi:hypothetical protein